MTVAEMLDRMSSREFSEWIEFWNLERFGDERADFRSAMAATAIGNRIGGVIGTLAGKKGPKPLELDDLMPFAKDDPTPDDHADTLLTKFRQIIPDAREAE